MTIQEELNLFLEKNGLESADVCRALNVSAALVSTFRKGKYKGDNEKFSKRLKEWMLDYSPYKDSSETETENIIITRNMMYSHNIINDLRGSNTTAVIYGNPGCGKTEMVKAYKKNNPYSTIVVTSLQGISTKDVLLAICDGLSFIPHSKSVPNLIKAIQDDILKNQLARGNIVFIFDEAENFKTSTLESIRQIRDETHTPFVLVGTYNLLGNLQGRGGSLGQLSSRIVRQHEFKEMEESEWTELFGKVAPFIRTITTNLRVAKENVYNTALRYANSKGEELDISHIKMVLPTVFIPR